MTALDRVDLCVQPGQAIGIAGPNGAGKSTLLRILLGLVRPTSGSSELFGEPVRPGMPALVRVGVLVDGPGFIPYLTGRRNIELGLRSSGKRVTPGQLHDELDRSGLGAALDRQYRSYSHGMRYRLALAQAFLGEPDLLMLDEPTTGLDPVHAIETVERLRSTVGSGRSLILSSHELPLIEAVCTDVAVLHQGRVVLSGRIADLIGSSGSLHEAYVEAVGRAAEQDLAGATNRSQRR